jgi:hypothetical protein
VADLSKLIEDLSGLTVLQAANLAELLKEKLKPSGVSLTDIKRDLPLWPDEVIKSWLFYIAKNRDVGWPPPEPAWPSLLGRHTRIQTTLLVAASYVATRTSAERNEVKDLHN